MCGLHDILSNIVQIYLPGTADIVVMLCLMIFYNAYSWYLLLLGTLALYPKEAFPIDIASKCCLVQSNFSWGHVSSKS